MGSPVCARRGEGQGTKPGHCAALCGAVDERGGQDPRVTLALTTSTAAGVGVSSDRPDTYRVRDGMEHWQGPHQHRATQILGEGCARGDARPVTRKPRT
jgi:hypothetical protein